MSTVLVQTTIDGTAIDRILARAPCRYDNNDHDDHVPAWFRNCVQTI